MAPFDDRAAIHRNLTGKPHQSLQNERHMAKCAEGSSRTVGRTVEYPLSLAVIAEAPGFQHAAAAKGVERLLQLFLVVHGREFRRGNPAIVEKSLLEQPVLRHLQCSRRRKDRSFC